MFGVSACFRIAGNDVGDEREKVLCVLLTTTGLAMLPIGLSTIASRWGQQWPASW